MIISGQSINVLQVHYSVLLCFSLNYTKLKLRNLRVYPGYTLAFNFRICIFKQGFNKI